MTDIASWGDEDLSKYIGKGFGPKNFASWVNSKVPQRNQDIVLNYYLLLALPLSKNLIVFSCKSISCHLSLSVCLSLSNLLPWHMCKMVVIAPCRLSPTHLEDLPQWLLLLPDFPAQNSRLRPKNSRFSPRFRQSLKGIKLPSSLQALTFARISTRAWMASIYSAACGV